MQLPSGLSKKHFEPAQSRCFLCRVLRPGRAVHFLGGLAGDAQAGRGQEEQPQADCAWTWTTRTLRVGSDAD